MAAIDDLKAGQAAIDSAVSDVATYLKDLAPTLQGGVSEADASAIAADLTAKAALLEAAIAPASTVAVPEAPAPEAPAPAAPEAVSDPAPQAEPA